MSHENANHTKTIPARTHASDMDRAYAAGWIAASRWAGRDDLQADIDSPAYERDRRFALNQIATRIQVKDLRPGDCLVVFHKTDTGIWGAKAHRVNDVSEYPGGASCAVLVCTDDFTGTLSYSSHDWVRVATPDEMALPDFPQCIARQMDRNPGNLVEPSAA